jgi:hypothetical protein
MLLVAAAAIVALAAHDVAAGVTGIALFGIAMATTISVAGTPDLLPRGTSLTRVEKSLLRNGVIATCATALAFLVIVAAASISPSLLLIPAVLAISLGIIALVIALR